MKINDCNERVLTVYLSENDLKFFGKNPFGNFRSRKTKNGKIAILSLGIKKSAYFDVKLNVVSLVITKEDLVHLRKGKDEIIIYPQKNVLGMSRIKIYFESDVVPSEELSPPKKQETTQVDYKSRFLSRNIGLIGSGFYCPDCGGLCGNEKHNRRW